jgi:hypothetical protein
MSWNCGRGRIEFAQRNEMKARPISRVNKLDIRVANNLQPGLSNFQIEIDIVVSDSQLGLEAANLDKREKPGLTAGFCFCGSRGRGMRLNISRRPEAECKSRTCR